MNVKMTARHFKLEESLKTYMTEKSQRLTRYFDHITDLEIILESEKQAQIVEMIIPVGAQKIVIKESSDDLKKSFDVLMDKAERQLKKHKAKINSKEKDTITSA